MGRKAGVKGMKAPVRPPPRTLEIGLADPGLTPILRAGLGGLAASLHAIERNTDVLLPGDWVVEPRRVVLDWGEPGRAGPFFEALFRASFRLTADFGLIDLPGTWRERRPPPAVLGALQDAMRQTFLQHGKHARKVGAPRTVTFEVDEKLFTVSLQGYESYVHQEVWRLVAAELDKPPDRAGTIELAGWANPGAVQRHVAFAETKMCYTPAEALCAAFALVGCLSFKVPRGGALVVPEPVDLVRFAHARPLLTPFSVRDVQLGGTGDAVLAVEVARRALETGDAPGSGVHVAGLRFRSTAWASQQKSRVDTVEAWGFQERALDLYARVAQALPARVIALKERKGDPGGYFTVPSSLRAFICENLARDLPWYRGFATVRDPNDPDRFLHLPYAPDNRGALRNDERKELFAMLDQLEEAERLLVRSVHTALRQRFGAIAEENKTNPVAMKNRMARERERLVLAFSGAKTHEQVRFALADLWSRAGTVKELRESWEQVLPLLRPAHWEAVRDLALVAMASYQGRSGTAEADDMQMTEQPTIGE